MKAHQGGHDFNEIKIHILAFSATDVRSIREAATVAASSANRYQR
jgi:hypothetical protein